ncbi:MAG: D-aminoacylase [Gemmatimonadaceae bacterium]|nr:D-aminoacylase [Gemmatimonadaceae bacterium]
MRLTLRAILLTLGSALAPSVAPVAAQPTTVATRYDILLRNGTVIDGTGARRQRADVGIRNGRIVAIDRKLFGRATTTIDATGLIVAPGFIDPHAHITTIAQAPLAENFLRQGVTTIFNSLHSLDQPYPLGAFLDTLHVAPNTMWTAGHTWARSRVMGRENRAPTDAELDQMKALVRDAMRDGAFGLGTGLEYIPAVYAKLPELVQLATAARAPGALYVTHLRDEGAALLPAIDEALTVGRAARLPVHISHIKSTGALNWGKSTDALARIDKANASRLRTTFDVYPYPAYSTYSDVLFPAWVLADGQDSVTARLARPDVRARLHREMPDIFKAQTAGTAEAIRFRTAPDSGLAGRTLAEVLKAQGKPDDVDTVIDRLIDLQARGGFTAVVQAMSEGDIIAFLKHPRGMVSTDGDLVTPGKGFPHPRSYGAFPRVIARYVGEQHVLTLEQAIAKMTSLPARSLGLDKRGLLRSGYAADVVVFDPATMRDVATFTDPHHYSEGVRHLFVNGVPVIRDGAITGEKPGVALRRGQ